MAKTVHEVMNRELFALRSDQRAADARTYLQMLGIHAAPVVDDSSCPIGMLSRSDLLGELDEATVGDRMTSPVIGIKQTDNLEDAARTFVRSGYHHLVVVDESGKARGFLSVLDALGAVLGMPVEHPSTFPHFDRPTGLVWTDDRELTEMGALGAPDEAGLFVLVQGGPGQLDRIVWAETSNNVRSRLLALIGGVDAAIAGEMEKGTLRFRAAAAPDAAQRKRAFDALGDRIISGGPPPPGR